MTQDLDKRTGRPYGDHGTAVNAIDFALNYERTGEIHAFLKGWMEGSLDEWPEFYAWLRTQAPEETTPPGPSPELMAKLKTGAEDIPLLADLQLHVDDIGHTETGENIRCAIDVIKDLAEKNEKLRGDLLMAYLKAPSPEAHLRVKPLEWRALAVTDRETAVADSILGKWEVWHFPGGGTYIMKPGEHQGTVYEDGYEEAKAYMERVYQRRIGPALATTEGSDHNTRLNIDLLAARIVTAACELDGPADPTDDDTISIQAKDLETLVHRHVTAATEEN